MNPESMVYSLVMFGLIFLYVAHIWEVRNGHE
jgi:hypothetical protein